MGREYLLNGDDQTLSKFFELLLEAGQKRQNTMLRAPRPEH